MNEEEMRKMLSLAHAYLCNVDNLLKHYLNNPHIRMMVEDQVESWIADYREMLKVERAREGWRG